MSEKEDIVNTILISKLSGYKKFLTFQENGLINMRTTLKKAKKPMIQSYSVKKVKHQNSPKKNP